MIRIASVERVGGQLAAVIGSARSPIAVREGVVIVVVDDRGGCGVGEASPFPGLSPDTLPEVEAALVRMRDALASREIADLDDGSANLLTPETVARWTQSLGESHGLRSLPSARFAFETALSDLAARRANVSTATWLSRGEAQASIERSVFLGAIGRDPLVEAARIHAARGARTFKVKVGGQHPRQELEALLEVRQVLDTERRDARDIRIRLDLNGALGVAEAREALALYSRSGVELCEEPVRGEDLHGLGRTPIPWFADESLVDPGLRQSLLAEAACSGFVLKPLLLGLFEARGLALAALASGKQVIVTHSFDGPVALAATCELALSLPRAFVAAGLDLHPALSAFPPTRIAQLPEAEEGATLSVIASGRPGIGVEWKKSV